MRGKTSIIKMSHIYYRDIIFATYYYFSPFLSLSLSFSLIHLIMSRHLSGKDKESSTDNFQQTILWTITNATFSSRSSSVNQLHSPYLYNLFYASLPLKNELSGYTSIINYMVSYFLVGNL